jgi:hypothetical protein
MATGNNRVLELDANVNTCVKQKVPVKPGRYFLEYDWAASDGIAFDSCKMGVYINNQVINSHVPSSYKVNTDRYQFNIESGSPDTIELSFCGEGTSDGKGAVLNNVHVFSLK